MSVTYVDIIVEEPSMEALLRALLPRLIPDVPFSIYSFQGKDELLERLPDRLRGYAHWLPENHRVVVIVDRDDDDCLVLKARLEAYAQAAGLSTRSHASGDRFSVINRIAIEELEAWYFGDWEAVRAAFPRVAATIPQQRSFRNPDSVVGGTWEAFERVLQRAGYFKTGLRKLEVARSIGLQMDPMRNVSHSFCVLRDAILELGGRL
ncbi:MAG: DUF4276 family protein [Anaerolineae bacterium]|nr:DUF4276 family protein [Anaerolineae bacterium]